jgi:hypothetical protein
MLRSAKHRLMVDAASLITALRPFSCGIKIAPCGAWPRRIFFAPILADRRATGAARRLIRPFAGSSVAAQRAIDRSSFGPAARLGTNQKPQHQGSQ